LEINTITDHMVCQAGFNARKFTAEMPGKSLRYCLPILNGPERGLTREADGFKPAANIDLGVGFATEMTGAWAQGGGQIPLDDRELQISTLNYKPMDRVLASDPANLALEFFHAGHGFSCEANG
jgi:hypothetical protein